MTDQNKTQFFRKSVLGDGTRVVTERVENVRSVAVGFWFETGARDELDGEEGISHFLEHMMFKGTKKRSALKIAREIEQVGGILNAYTSKEVTVYYVHLLDQHLSLAVDVLADIVCHSKFADKEVDKERGVILEEIANSDDTPEDVIHEDFIANVFPAHALGKPVLGKRETVSAFTGEQLYDYWQRHYTSSRLVVAAAGGVDHDKLVRMIEQKIDLSPEGKAVRIEPDALSVNGTPFIRRKEITQAHICLGCRAPAFPDPSRYALLVMNTLLGSGMSSRLFQRIREKNGLAYSVYSFQEAFSDSGIFGVYAGTEESQVEKVVRLVKLELDKLRNKSLSKAELKRTKDQLKGAVVLGLESVSTRMNRLGRLEIFLNKYVSLDDLINNIDKVTVEEVSAVADKLFSGELQRTFLLPSKQ